MNKYIVVKRDPSDGRVYVVQLANDMELAQHISGTFENTDHVIISITNTQA